MRRFTMTGVLLLATALAFAQTADKSKSVSQGSKTTLENLMEAYNGESNAKAKYAKYAEKADAEGYKKVAALFRAASRAEAIHAESHAAVIKKMGGTPKADVKQPEVKSTRENLQDALRGETYEHDTMYAGFLKQAKEEGDRPAARTFNFARNVEAGHAKLYQQALDNLDQWKEAGSFFVCPVCGNTVAKLDFKKCPICDTPSSKFEKVS